MSTTPTNVKEAQFEQYTRPYLKTVPRGMNARSHCTKSSITSWNAYHGFKGIGGKTERLFYTAAKGLDRVPSVNHNKRIGLKSYEKCEYQYIVISRKCYSNRSGDLYKAL